MRTLLMALPLAWLCAACTTTGGGRAVGADAALDASPNPATAISTPDGMPRLVIPTSGDVPVLSIPLGGGLYQPVTGGLPTPGIPVSP